MSTRFIISESIHGLRTNALRSLLTIIGIIVGIFSVTAMLALGEGLTQNVLARLSAFSQGDVSISGTLTTEDLGWINNQMYVANALGTQSISSSSALIANESFSPTIQSVVGDYQKVQSFSIVTGEVFDFINASLSDMVAVVSETFDTAVREKTGISAYGQRLRINGQIYEVIGVIKTPTAGFQRGDGTVWIPFAAMSGVLTDQQGFSSISVKLKDQTQYAIVGQHIQQALNTSRRLAKDDTATFTISSAQSMIESAQETTKMFSLFLGIVGAIALFVGGIGTMNMMLTTVTERTQEIGLRKAIGARNKDILFQILLESVLLTFIGGIIGILLTIIGATLATHLLGENSAITIVLSPKVFVIATIVSIAVGIFFGWYPAYNASRLQPVEALRSE